MNDDTRRPSRDHVFDAAARERGNYARDGHMVKQRPRRIGRWSLKIASAASTRCRHCRAIAVATGRKWPCRDDRLRGAEFGYGDKDAAAERNLAPMRVPSQNFAPY